MISKAFRTVLVAGVVLLALLPGTTPALAAAPRVILVYGPPLTQPVMFQDWDENLQLMQAVAEDAAASSRELKHRPFLSVALFWGMYWGQYLQHGKLLAVFRPERANQCAWFYPAYGLARPLWVFRSVPGPPVLLIRRISPTGIAILARHGVPVRLTVSRHLATSTDNRCQAP